MDFAVISGASICVIAFLVILAGGFWLAAGDRYEGTKIRVYSVLLALAGLAGLIVVLFPFSGDYLSYRNETGRVSAVSSRFLSSGSGSSATVNQRYAVSILGKGTYGCDDTRCSLIKANDTVTLSCEKEWQWHGNPGWVCSFVSAYGPDGKLVA